MNQVNKGCHKDIYFSEPGDPDSLWKRIEEYVNTSEFTSPSHLIRKVMSEFLDKSESGKKGLSSRSVRKLEGDNKDFHILKSSENVDIKKFKNGPHTLLVELKNIKKGEQVVIRGSHFERNENGKIEKYVKEIVLERTKSGYRTKTQKSPQ